MQFVADNKRDFLLYFAGCFLAKTDPTTGEKRIFQVKSRRDAPIRAGGDEGANDSIVLKDLKARKNIKENWTTVVDDYELHPTSVGMTNIDPTVIYISRKPARQYRKGLHFNERQPYSIWCPHYEYLRRKRLYPGAEKIATACFTSQYTDLKTAVQQITEGEVLGRALTRYYGVYAPVEHKGICLIYKDRNIGEITPDAEIRLHEAFLPYKEGVEKATGTNVVPLRR